MRGGATVSGAVLADCVVAFSRAARFGKESVLTGDASGLARFEFADAASLAGTRTDPNGETSFAVTPDGAWITVDGAWVRGDPDSADPQAVLAAGIGEVYRAAADPRVTANLVAASAGWQEQTAQDVISLDNGVDQPAWRLQVLEPFTWAGLTVQEMILWMADGHVVVGTQGTSDAGGVLSTTTQHFYDWGEPVSIEPPVA